MTGKGLKDEWTAKRCGGVDMALDWYGREGGWVNLGEESQDGKRKMEGGDGERGKRRYNGDGDVDMDGGF